MYELLKTNKIIIKKLANAGIIDPHWIRDIEMFEDFENLETNCMMCKYTIIANKYKLNIDTVRRRIKELKG